MTTPQELLDRALALVPALKERAADTEKRRALSGDVMAELFSAGLLRVFDQLPSETFDRP